MTEVRRTPRSDIRQSGIHYTADEVIDFEATRVASKETNRRVEFTDTIPQLGDELDPAKGSAINRRGRLDRTDAERANTPGLAALAAT